jgi:cyclase
LVEAVNEGRADAVLVAGILHDGVTTVHALKDVMRMSGISVRDVELEGMVA